MNFKGIIGKLISDGDLVLYHDYRGGTATDLSGNGNDGAYTGTVWSGPGKGIGFPETTSRIAITDSAELQGTEWTLVSFGDFSGVLENNRIFSKEDGAGANIQYEFYRNNVNTQWRVYDGATESFLAHAIAGDKCTAVNINTGEAPEFFVDGISIGNGNAVLTITADDAVMAIGNGGTLNSLQLGATLKAALIINRKLTATEHSQLYAQLNSMKWPSKSKSFGKVEIGTDASEDGLVGSWSMKIINGIVVDESGNGNDGVVTGPVGSGKSILGSVATFKDNNDYIACPNIDFTSSNFTISSWIHPTTATNVDPIMGTGNPYNNGGTGWIFDYWGAGASDPLRLQINNGAGAGTSIISNLEDVSGQWSHVACVVDRTNDTVDLYHNGEFLTQGDISAQTGGSLGADAVRIGAYGITTSISFDGEMGTTKLYNEKKDATWVKKQYAQGARALNFSTNYSIPDTISNVTSGNIPGSPIYVDSGSFKVITEDVNCNEIIKEAKVLECVTAGICYIKNSDFFASPTESAYGSWEWWFYKGADGNDEKVAFISDLVATEAAYNDAYYVKITNTERIGIYEYAGGAVQAALMRTNLSHVSNQEWLKIKITRSASGVFTFYENDTILGDLDTGSNPSSADTTTTSSDYILFEIDAGDKIVLSSIDKAWVIKKQLGAIS